MVELNINVPESFYAEEKRAGFFVDRLKKQVWAVEMDLLSILLKVCQENGLACFVDAGTLLGTIRHKGFIPWDDDIDVCMFREDYDKLVKIANRCFEHPYKFQCYYTEQFYPRGHAQLRNTSTTCLLESEEDNNIRFNQGIFIDIFVLDDVPSEDEKVEKLKKKVERYRSIIYYKCDFFKNSSVNYRIKSAIIKCLPGSYTFYAKRLELILRKQKFYSNGNVAPLNFIFDTKKRIRMRKLYAETIWLPFEFLTVPVPRGYDIYLKNRYGEYMRPAQVPTTHGGAFLDVEHPDSFYLGKK